MQKDRYGGLLDTLDVFSRCGILSEKEMILLSMDLLIEDTSLRWDELNVEHPDIIANINGRKNDYVES